MKQKLFRTLLMGLAVLSMSTGVTSCSSDDDDNDSNSVATLQQGNDQRPVWQAPNYDSYEMTMTIEVQLQDTLQAYASDQDLLCATINGEVRGVAQPKQVGTQWVFQLTVGSNQTGSAVSLSYYCDRLHRIFTNEWTKFDATLMPMGTGEIYQPVFVR